MSDKATAKEIKDAAEEKAYWQELSDLTGWRLYGWTYKQHVTYFSDARNSVELTGTQRDDIMRAIQSAAKRARGTGGTK